MVDAVAGGIMQLGHKAHGRIGVYGINSPEWMIAMQVPGQSPLHASSSFIPIKLHDSYPNAQPQYAPSECGVSALAPSASDC